MDTPAEIYRELSTKFTDVVEAVPSDAWQDPSPCEDWTAAAVLEHVTNAERSSLGAGKLTLREGPSPQSEPLAAWADTREQIQAVLDDPEQAGITFDGFFGPTTLGESIADYYCFDLVVHRWDIAKAAGGDTSISADEIAFVRAKLELYGDAMRMPGVFKEAIDPPPGADEQTQLLAFIGRIA